MVFITTAILTASLILGGGPIPFHMTHATLCCVILVASFVECLLETNGPPLFIGIHNESSKEVKRLKELFRYEREMYWNHACYGMPKFVSTKDEFDKDTNNMIENGTVEALKARQTHG
jgi:hypothetical protein